MLQFPFLRLEYPIKPGAFVDIYEGLLKICVICYPRNLDREVTEAYAITARVSGTLCYEGQIDIHTEVNSTGFNPDKYANYQVDSFAKTFPTNGVLLFEKDKTYYFRFLSGDTFYHTEFEVFIIS